MKYLTKEPFYLSEERCLKLKHYLITCTFNVTGSFFCLFCLFGGWVGVCKGCKICKEKKLLRGFRVRVGLTGIYCT